MKERILRDIIVMLKNCDEKQLCMIRGFTRGVSNYNEQSNVLSDEDVDLILTFIAAYTQKKSKAE